jgi:large subunit ribosomal protein L22
LKNESLKIEEQELVVKSVNVDAGRQLKRLRPAPQGRGHRIRKRSNHITLIVDNKNAFVAAENNTAN